MRRSEVTEDHPHPKDNGENGELQQAWQEEHYRGKHYLVSTISTMLAVSGVLSFFFFLSFFVLFFTCCTYEERESGPTPSEGTLLPH